MHASSKLIKVKDVLLYLAYDDNS